MARRIKLKLLRQNKKQASKKTDGRILLYSDISDALYDEMPREEREALLEAKQLLEQKVYLGKVMRDLRIALEPVAIKSQLSPQGKQIFWNIRLAATSSPELVWPARQPCFLAAARACFPLKSVVQYGAI